MMQFRSKGFLSSFALVLLSLIFNNRAQAQSGSRFFDSFDRPASLTLNQPSSGAQASWLETETAGSNNYRVRVENNMLVMGSLNSATGGVGSSGPEQASLNVSGQYATVYNQASAPMTWAFNFRQNRSGTSGFGATTYGIAYIIGSSKAVFTDPTASGYAVIIGNSGSPDYVKLVSFKNGFTANSNLTTLVSSLESVETAFYSVKVTFDPCAKSWGLQVRNDGAAFSDPTTLQDPALTFADQTYTNLNLDYTGALYNHGTVNVSANFDNINLPAAPAQTAQTYTWTGAISTDFTDQANWNPARTCFRVSDILSFNSGGFVTVSNISSQEIGQLLVQNNTNLTLKAKTGSTQILQLSGGEKEDLVVGAGSALVIDSNDALELSLKAGATGSVAGTISFQNSVQNLGRAHRLFVADANALILHTGAQFIAKNLNGEPFGTSGAANAVVFNAGSVYVAKDGASPFGLVTPNSKVVFQAGSLYRHEQTGTAPKFDGRVYADFELNVSGNLAIIFGTSATVPTRIDNFTISGGNMNVTLASGTTALPLHIRGNLTVNPGATFNYTPAGAVNTSTISLVGFEPQVLSGNINLGQFANLEVNNPAGIALHTNLSVRGNLALTNGVVQMAASRSLTFEDNATVSGVGNASYVHGKVLKTGDDAFTFPTGKGGFYAPIAISAPTNPADQFAAEYFYSDPNQLFGSNATDSLVQISSHEYWDLERLAGTSEVNVSLSYDPQRSAYVADPQLLRIAHFKAGAGWVNEGKVAINNAASYSFYATARPQASFSPFTFGSVVGNGALPVALLYFQAKSKNKLVELNWATATETNNDRFEIERSGNGKDFKKIGELKSNGNSNSEKRYAFSDKNPFSGTNYYRLKQIDLDGSHSYSGIVSVKHLIQSAQLKLYPNPTREMLTLQMSDPLHGGEQIKILNALGMVVKTVSVQQAKTEINLNVANLPAGIYFLQSASLPQPVRFQKL